MDSHKKRLKDFLEKSDEDLLMIIEISPHTPDGDLANAVLQYKLKKSIVKLRKTIEKFNRKSTRYTKILIRLTIIMTITVVIQIILLILK